MLFARGQKGLNLNIWGRAERGTNMFFYYNMKDVGFRIESLSEQLFTKLGFELFLQPHNNNDVMINKEYFDFGMFKQNNKYAVEVKCSTSPDYRILKSIESSIIRLIDRASKEGMIPILMVYSFISEREKEEFRKKHKNLVLLDLSNILYLAKRADMYDKVLAVLPFTIDQVENEPVDLLNFSVITADASIEDELPEIPPFDLSGCAEGSDGAPYFEDLCSDVLEKIFSDSLTLWERQPRSNSDLYRFDLLCRIKDDENNEGFWHIVERFFNSKYIVFEYKNYKDEITQKEIYSTERYLYNKALRNVAIIIARNGFDEHSEWAAKGCLRENGKLIILLNIADINRMIQIKNEHEDPANVLLEKLDTLLIKLEK